MQACKPLRLSVRLFRHTSSTSVREYATSNPLKPEIYDVVCVGGGPAGLSLVTALRASKVTSNLKIALIEGQELAKSAGPRHASTKEYSNRCSSLTPASMRFLEDIGAWKHVDHSRVQPYDEMKVWDGVSGSRITFDWHSIGASPYGGQRNIAYMTENTNLTSGLLHRAHELGGIEMMDNVKVADIQLGEDSGEHDMRSWPVISLSSGATIAARLLVGADGANSPVRTFAGIASRGWDYNRHGLVATLRLGPGATSDYNLATAYQRFLPTGPAALLPLPNGQASLVWSTTPAHAAALKALSTPDFIAMVNAAFRLSPTDLQYLHTMPAGQADEVNWRMQHTPFDHALVPPMIESVQDGSIASFPLKLRHADTYTGERVALVGDAAHTIHPLAGQGLNQGQGDVQALLDTITEAVETGQDVGSTLALESYNLKRYAANNMLMGVVDKLHKLYSVQSGPVVALRSWGLSAVDALPAVKEFFMKRAAGS